MAAHLIELVSPEATAEAGRALGAVVRAGDLIGLIGNLGAGKTLFVQAFARGLGVPESVAVVSPTFTLVNEYDGGRARLYHADLYRIEREVELDEIGLDEMCRRGDGVVVIEWADRFSVLPGDHLAIQLDIAGDTSRAMRVSAGGAASAALLDRWLGSAGTSVS